MARVTVEDCVLKVPNRFELVMIASQRARELHGGAQPSLDRDNDKDPVVSLREIADQTVSLDVLREQLIRGHQKLAETEEAEPEIVELMAGEQTWVRDADGEGLAIEGEDEDEDDDGLIGEDEEGEPSAAPDDVATDPDAVEGDV